jgi:hypothetical protein
MRATVSFGFAGCALAILTFVMPTAYQAAQLLDPGNLIFGTDRKVDNRCAVIEAGISTDILL